MKNFSYTITDALGIHARPAGLLVKEAAKFQSTVKIEGNGKSADAKKIFAIMSLGVKCGTEVTVSFEGADEEAACSAIEEFFRANL